MQMAAGVESNTRPYYDADRQMKCQLSFHVCSEASALTGEVDGCHLINDRIKQKAQFDSHWASHLLEFEQN